MNIEPAHPSPASLSADRLYRELTYRPHGPVARRIRAAYTVLGGPGEAPGDEPQPGDILVRVALGVPGAGHLSVIVDEVSLPVGDRSGSLPLGHLLLRPTAGACRGDVPDTIDVEGYESEDAEQAVLRTGALDDSEWGQLDMWLGAGQVGTDPLTGAADANATLVAGAIFCGRKIGTPDAGDDPLLCVDPSVTAADPRAQALKAEVVARGPIVNWARVPDGQRRARVMNLLVDTHGYPVNGAAGLVGNLFAESAVLPNRIEGSDPATPMRARDFRGVRTDFSASDVMNRSRRNRRGPRRPGIGLAQWTTVARRAGLFAHRHGTKPAGARILFDMDAQVDYLVNELRTSFAAVDTVLRDPAVTVDDASDDVVYRFEIPGSIIHNGVRLPRAHPAVQGVFRARRRLARTALAEHQAAPVMPAPGPADADAGEDIFDRQCGFFPPSGPVVTEVSLRAAIVDVATDERRLWLDAAGTRLLRERVVDQFGHLVRYRLATLNGMLPGTLIHVQAVATNGTINYRPLLAATTTAAVNAAAAAIRVQLLAGAPGAGVPANLDGLIDGALKSARLDRADRTPWSSAFVSACVRRVAINLGLESDASGTHQGRDVLLRASGGHRFYLHEAHRRSSGPGQRDGTYQAFPPADREVRRGDIIVQDRQAERVADVWPFRRIPDILPGRELHGDIVVDVVNGDHAITVGGNLGGTVSRRKYPLDANSRLVVAQSQLYTQEANSTVFPPWPATSTADLHDNSTARIFALLSPVATCIIVPGALFR